MSNDALTETLQTLEGKGYKPIYDRIVKAVIDATWSRDYHFTVYPIYDPDGYQGITEEQQQRRAGRETAIITGIMNAPKVLGNVTGYWQVLIQPDRDENPVKIFPKPIPMTPRTPDKPLSVSDTLDCIELLKKHIPENAAADRAMLYTKYCLLQYGQVPETDETGDPYKMLTYTAEEQAETEEREQETELYKLFDGFSLGESAADLAKQNIPPTTWIYNGLLQRQGVSVLAGAPKAGKSYFALQLAIHAARGDKFLNWTGARTDVLYLDIDHPSKSRTQKRIIELAGDNIPENFIYWTPGKGEYFPTLDEKPRDTLGAIKYLMTRYNREKGLHIGLVIIDIYAAILPQNGSRNLDAYRQGRAEMKNLVKFAADNEIMILLVHHLNKAKDNEDPYNRISGSNALYSAVDAGLILSRSVKEKQTTLFVNGSDQEPGEYILQFNNGVFEYKGTADDVSQTYADKLYKEHPIRKALVYLIDAAGMVTGSLSDILEEYETRTKTNLPYLPKQVSDFISKYEDKLRDLDGIKYTYMRHGRRYTFEKTEQTNIHEIVLDENE